VIFVNAYVPLDVAAYRGLMALLGLSMGTWSRILCSDPAGQCLTMPPFAQDEAGCGRVLRPEAAARGPEAGARQAERPVREGVREAAPHGGAPAEEEGEEGSQGAATAAAEAIVVPFFGTPCALLLDIFVK
jgi:hypothetical protein